MTALDNIKAALEAGPTEGPWRYWSCTVDSSLQPPMYHYAQFANVAGSVFRAPLRYLRKEDADFIAACNPTAIRELLAYVESLERERIEDQGVIAVWRRRTQEAEAKVESLDKDAARWRTAIAMPWVLTGDSQDYHWGISIARVPGAEAADDPEVIIDAAMEHTK